MDINSTLDLGINAILFGFGLFVLVLAKAAYDYVRGL